METNVKINNDYNWYVFKKDDFKIFNIGGFWLDDEYFSGVKASKKIFSFVEEFLNSESKSLNFIDNFIKKISGHFAIVVESFDFIFAMVDKIRSYPLFYSITDKNLYLSNIADSLKKEKKINTSSYLEIQMAGYVSKSNTIYQGLNQLKAGEYLYLKKERGKLILNSYFEYIPKAKFDFSELELLEHHHSILNKTIKKTIESLSGKPVWIPLSGGLDSRLILSKMIEFNYDNINTFTYGIPNIWEVKYAREITKSKNIRWHFIEYEPDKVRELFNSDERKKYYKFASGLCSIPFTNEFYALKKLIDDKKIHDNAIIINGQSGDFTTGGHIPLNLMNCKKESIDYNYLIKLIIEKHYSLWMNLKTNENIKIISEKILDVVSEFFNKIADYNDVAAVYEFYEWRERQSKYVVNGQRQYDWFGFDWRLPLWSDELIDFWVNVPWRIKFDQNLYKKYLDYYNPENLFTFEIKVNKNYYPYYLKLMNIFYSRLSKLFNLDQDFFNRTFMKYYGAYSPFYPQKNYFEYLKKSKYHRNTVSYYSEIFLKELEQ